MKYFTSPGVNPDPDGVLVLRGSWGNCPQADGVTQNRLLRFEGEGGGVSKYIYILTGGEVEDFPPPLLLLLHYLPLKWQIRIAALEALNEVRNFIDSDVLLEHLPQGHDVSQDLNTLVFFPYMLPNVRP